ncbi:hypothetical protein Pla22_12560 [Rubripirellula amarantea]|uniref:Uncharacterized protein n=1 Tax=Rubripirellula amarantea TaxID=2527999 RepID=A0A5C5WS40_9BACT|nr:hypothetical protein [Rubripirellula amarantea]TWT53626.1 hypothetical protein Pla22_12560 [Rubripirellula amarantea]
MTRKLTEICLTISAAISLALVGIVESAEVDSHLLRCNAIAEQTFDDGFQTLAPLVVNAPATTFDAGEFSTRVMIKNRLARVLEVQDVT